MEFKDKLKFLRNSKNISQNDLAKLLNVSRSTISNYEYGRNYPTNEILIQLCSYFNVTADMLLNDEQEISLSSNIDENKILGGLSAKYEKLNQEQKEFIKRIG